MNASTATIDGTPVDPGRRVWLRAAAALALASGGVRAAGPWPDRPIKWVVPYLPGTAPDVEARVVSQAATPLLGQSIVIENRAGAGGTIGARQVAHAAPDGYTWLYSAAPMAADMVILRDPGFDVLKDFRHVTRLSTADVVLIVDPASGITTTQQLIERARTGPGMLAYASGGVGTPSHLGMELFLAEAGIHATHVPYKGASELVNAVLGSQVAFGMPILSVAYPLVKKGKLRALAVASARRNPMLPDVPTLTEQGIPGVELASWGGVSFPAGVPDAVVDRVDAVLRQVMQQPAVVKTLTDLGDQIRLSASPAAFVETIRAEIALTSRMMATAHLSPA